MFFPVESNSNGRTGICLRKIAYIGMAFLAAALIIAFVSYNAFAGQSEDVSAAVLGGSAAALHHTDAREAHEGAGYRRENGG